MNNWKWTVGAIAYMCVLAYSVSLIVYQFGSWFVGTGNIVGTVIAEVLLALILYLLFRPNPNEVKRK